MSFASPLSVGYATNGDYLEIGLTQPVDAQQLREALDAVMPRDIRIHDVHMARDGAKKLMAQNYSACYFIHFHFENEQDCVKIKTAVSGLLEAEEYPAVDRRGRQLDIRPLVLDITTTDGKEISVLLKNASDGALNPAVVAMALLSAAEVDADYDICREDCFARKDGEMKPFSII